MNAVKYLAIALLLALLAGCASYPISDQFRQQARQITLDQVRADPEGTRGKIVIWGGRIINVVNESNSSSIYIVCLPYRENEEPVPYAPSPGRFIATSTGFLDPEMFPHGSLITVAGQLDGVRTEPLQHMQYPYPVLNIEETHIWHWEPEQYGAYPYYGYYGPDWYWNYGGWGWGGWGWGPAWWWYGGPYYGGYHGAYHGNFNGGGGYHGGGYHGGGGGSYHGSGGGGGSHGGGGGGGGGGGHGR